MDRHGPVRDPPDEDGDLPPDREECLLELATVVGGAVGIVVGGTDDPVTVEIGEGEYQHRQAVEIGAGQRVSERGRRSTVGGNDGEGHEAVRDRRRNGRPRDHRPDDQMTDADDEVDIADLRGVDEEPFALVGKDEGSAREDEIGSPVGVDRIAGKNGELGTRGRSCREQERSEQELQSLWAGEVHGRVKVIGFESTLPSVRTAMMIAVAGPVVKVRGRVAWIVSGSRSTMRTPAGAGEPVASSASISASARTPSARVLLEPAIGAAASGKRTNVSPWKTSREIGYPSWMAFSKSKVPRSAIARWPAPSAPLALESTSGGLVNPARAPGAWKARARTAPAKRPGRRFTGAEDIK